MRPPAPPRSCRGVVVLAVCASYSLAGCSDSAPPSSPEGAGDVVIRTVEQDGLRFTLSAARALYGPGERVDVTVEVENAGGVPVRYLMPGPAGPAISVAVETGFLGALDLAGPTDPLSPPLARVGTLAPGRRVKRGVVWNQEIVAGVAAPPGAYAVAARLHRLGSRRQDPDPAATVRVTALFVIEGTQPLLAPTAALTLALREPAIAAWYVANGARLVCTLRGERVAIVDGGSVYAADAASASSADPAGSRAAKLRRHGQDEDPTCVLHLRAGPHWIIELASETGPLPGAFTVLVDAAAGRVLEVSTGTR